MNTRARMTGYITWYAIALLGIAASFTAPSAALGEKLQKIGVVDFREVALGSKAGKAAKARLEKMAEKLKKEMKAEEAKLLARQKELESAGARLTQTERQDRSAKLEQDEAAFQRLLEDKTEELKNAEAQSLQELATKFDSILKTYAAEKGFSVILETQRPGILYFDKSLDLSAEMIKRFDRTAK